MGNEINKRLAVKIGDSLRKIRLSQGDNLTQEDVAEGAGISTRYYTYLELGQKMPSFEVEGYLTAGVFTFAKCYFCAAHNSQLLFLFASMLSTSSRMKYTKFPHFIRGTLCALKTQ